MAIYHNTWRDLPCRCMGPQTESQGPSEAAISMAKASLDR